MSTLTRNPPLGLRHLPLLLLALLAGGCSKCGKGTSLAAGPELARFLPRDAEVAIGVPNLGALGRKISVLEGLKVASFSAQLQGFSDANAYATALMGQLGVDLRSEDAIAGAGIDPGRGVAVALLRDELAYSVVAVKDAAKLEKMLHSLSNNRLGAGQVTRREGGGVTVISFSESSGTPPRLGFVIKDGFAFVAAGASIDKLPLWAALTPESSLARDEALSASLTRLPAARDVWLHLPPGSTLASQSPFGGGTIAVSLTSEALTLFADVPWSLAPEALHILDRRPGPELFGLLPPDAFLVARFAGDPETLGPYWGRLVGPHLERAFVGAGFDFKAEVLGNMKPGAVVAVSLAPDVKLAGGVPALDVRYTNPFRYAHLAAVAEARDAAKVQATLGKLEALAPRFGARIEPAERLGKRVFVTQYSQGEGVHFAAVGDKVVVGAPMMRLEELLGRVLAPDPRAGPLLDPALRKVFDDRAVAVGVDLRRLAQSVKDLPSNAWGVGGFAIKATTVRWLDATDDLRAVMISLSAKEKAVQAEVSLRFQKPPRTSVQRQ